MRHNPSLRLPWFAPGKRIEGCHRFSTLSVCHLLLHPIALGRHGQWVDAWRAGRYARRQCVSVGRIVLTAPRRPSQPCCGWGRGAGAVITTARLYGVQTACGPRWTTFRQEAGQAPTHPTQTNASGQVTICAAVSTGWSDRLGKFAATAPRIIRNNHSPENQR
jgi:hypothetical protein